jgi:sulfonate transport system ATP-binding protein
MSGKPGVVKKVIPIEIARERNRTSPEFASYRRQIFMQFFETKTPEIEYMI